MSFADNGGRDGLAAWLSAREKSVKDLARANGIPLGHPCRVELIGGVVLEGNLMQADEPLLTVEVQRDPGMLLRIGRCVFSLREVVSVVRMD